MWVTGVRRLQNLLVLAFVGLELLLQIAAVVVQWGADRLLGYLVSTGKAGEQSHLLRVRHGRECAQRGTEEKLLLSLSSERNV